ncbi:hypothetical protein QJS66_08710 [Kocuria rhizophila]|nr:hypothetical protein QJS66_08710 [Kocuria rhizophila]
MSFTLVRAAWPSFKLHRKALTVTVVIGGLGSRCCATAAASHRRAGENAYLLSVAVLVGVCWLRRRRPGAAVLRRRGAVVGRHPRHHASPSAARAVAAVAASRPSRRRTGLGHEAPVDVGRAWAATPKPADAR